MANGHRWCQKLKLREVHHICRLSRAILSSIMSTVLLNKIAEAHFLQFLRCHLLCLSADNNSNLIVALKTIHKINTDDNIHFHSQLIKHILEIIYLVQSPVICHYFPLEDESGAFRISNASYLFLRLILNG